MSGAAPTVMPRIAAMLDAYRRRFVPDVSPAVLGGIRAWSSLVLLGYVLTSDLSKTARLPPEMLVSAGAIDHLHRLPGFDAFLASESALALFSAFTAVALLLSALGLAGRWTTPLAALSAAVYNGLFQHHTYFYHQFLIGLYVLIAVSCGPAGDAFSVDAWLRRRRGLPPPARAAGRYGWARYLCWTVLALPYWLAGWSKLRGGGWGWWDALNLRGKVYRDSLQGGIFDHPLGLELIGAPDWIFSGIGIFTLILELGFISVLFSARARRILPLLAIGMHLGILALQNFVFVDAVLMQLIFFDWDAVFGKRRAAPAVESRPPAVGPALGVFAAAAVLCCGWFLRLESYPITSWKMYSDRRTNSELVYYRARATLASGETIAAPYGDCFPAPTFNPFVRMPRYAFQEGRPERMARNFFRACATELNRGRAPAQSILSFRMEKWRWDYREQPEPPGELLDVREIPAGPRSPSAPAGILRQTAAYNGRICLAPGVDIRVTDRPAQTFP